MATATIINNHRQNQIHPPLNGTATGGDLLTTTIKPSSPSSARRLASRDFLDCKDMSASKVVQFYEGKSILITGATGFLGKVLLWKLLESCSNVNKIYVLLRSKNSISAERRMTQLLKTKPFNYNEERHGHLLQKVTVIESDVTQVGLGLNDKDLSMIQENVNIVFHCAASVKFDAPLKDNYQNNFLGTKYIVDLCNTIKNLNGLVHVSTAYSNCQARNIEEKIVPLEKELDDIVRIVETLPDDVSEIITDKLLEGRPNTYTFTKAMAEQYVSRQEGNYPISIVRPSIVVSSIQEPEPGWVDNVNGMAGLGCLASIGLLRNIDWDYDAISDMVPVDIVANCLICAAYQIAEHSPDKMLICNMTSGTVNPVSWGEFFRLLKIYALKTPSTKIVRPMIDPPKYKRANPITFFLTRFFSELLFAYFIDTILFLLGYKKVMVKMTRRMHHGYKILLPFITNDWNFISKNVENLYDSLQPIDKKLFKFDMRNFDWEEEAYHLWSGVRLHLLKEERTEESFKSGLRRQTLVIVIHYTGLGIIIALAGYLLYYGATSLGLF